MCKGPREIPGGPRRRFSQFGKPGGLWTNFKGVKNFGELVHLKDVPVGDCNPRGELERQYIGTVNRLITTLRS